MSKRHYQVSISFYEYDSIEELSQDDKTLLLKAREAAEKAYAPYSRFRVGAAALLANGLIITGSNQENAAYPSGLCAERVTLFSAQAQYPDTPILAIAITAIGTSSKISEPLPPCGACRQVMTEVESRYHHDLKVIMQGEEGKIIISEKMENLMPLTFAEDFLKKYS